MAMEFNIVNLIQFFSYVSPFLLGFFLVMISFFNKDVKGIIYLGGVLLFSYLALSLQPIIKSQTSFDASPSCNLFELGNNNYNSPALHSVFIAFTFAYLFMPMYTNNTMNYYVLAAILSLFFMDAFSKVYNKCTTNLGVFIGGLIGFIFGVSYWAIFHFTNTKEALFFQNEASNNVVCNRPSRQTFKCAVYKNGKLLKTL
jgi:hypothetical protein